MNEKIKKIKESEFYEIYDKGQFAAAKEHIVILKNLHVYEFTKEKFEKYPVLRFKGTVNKVLKSDDKEFFRYVYKGKKYYSDIIGYCYIHKVKDNDILLFDFDFLFDFTEQKYN